MNHEVKVKYKGIIFKALLNKDPLCKKLALEEHYYRDYFTDDIIRTETFVLNMYTLGYRSTTKSPLGLDEKDFLLLLEMRDFKGEKIAAIIKVDFVRGVAVSFRFEISNILCEKRSLKQASEDEFFDFINIYNKKR